MKPPVIFLENLRPLPTASRISAGWGRRQTNHVYPLPRKTRRLFIALHYLLTALTPVVENEWSGENKGLEANEILLIQMKGRFQSCGFGPKPCKVCLRKMVEEICGCLASFQTAETLHWRVFVHTYFI
ncbi:hypothetical protein CEXT_523891 [Caerostris extrusa]|uniref:Uncharacterized protein n=1 Tax=Caerostris extrusa TaxID=172846 RepID=A0AAV4XNL1_CAEEX|nr:hypothetical protein CEXT_523891 [Caerostris extrusa]